MFSSNHGLSWDYYKILKFIPKKWPVYALQAKGLNGGEKCYENFDDMVNEYLSHIKKIQPHGPYKLLGWSMGGVIAHEVGCRLQKNGQAIDLLAILDGYPVIDKSTRVNGDTFELLVGLISEFGYTKKDLGNSPIKNAFKIITNEQHPLSTLTYSEFKRMLSIGANNAKLLNMHVPNIFDGNVELFKATNNSRIDQHIIWGQFVTGKIEITKIHSTHSGLMNDASLKEISKRLLKTLRDAG